MLYEWIDNDTRITQGKNAQLDGNISASQAEAASDSNGKPSVSALLYYEEVEKVVTDSSGKVKSITSTEGVGFAGLDGKKTAEKKALHSC